MSKKESNAYLEELNDKQDKLNRLIRERDSLVIKYFLMEQEANKYRTIVFQLQDYVNHLAGEPTHKSYGGTLQEILEILEGGNE